uniref:Uncharacterized protein n=1 Tax=Rhizophora mucronata TaxID=61149 RepID=A0A2P2IVR1_RHIMU
MFMRQVEYMGNGDQSKVACLFLSIS